MARQLLEIANLMAVAGALFGGWGSGALGGSYYSFDTRLSFSSGAGTLVGGLIKCSSAVKGE
jgi:hypothetical protein